MIHTSKKLIKVCKAKTIKIVTAESCTGGMLSTAITAINGSSLVFDRGFITYSYESKSDLLNVLPLTLKNFGAVSPEVAIEMVKGAVENSDSNLAISVTGIAGPNGATIHKPVGLVYMATSVNGVIKCYGKNFEGSRSQIRKAASLYSLQLLLKEALEI